MPIAIWENIQKQFNITKKSAIGEYQFKKQFKYYEKGLQISSAIGDQSGIASNNGNLGNAYCNLGEYPKAIQYYEKGLQISSAIGNSK